MKNAGQGCARIRSRLDTALRVAALAAALLGAALADAAELGRVTLASGAGQPLNAEIEIGALASGEDRTLSVRLASRQQMRQAGIDLERQPADLEVSLGRRAGRLVVRLRTARPVTEPFVDAIVILRSSTGFAMRRYTVLLDPTGYRPAPVAPAKEPAPPAAAIPEATTPAKPGIEWRGFVQSTAAYDYREPKHWSRGVVRTQLGAQGDYGSIKWKGSARLDVDPVYAGDDFYPDAVRRDQRSDFLIRETFFDLRAGGLEWRVGRQNIVWGEMVGLFFADVVSARDQRDFILPEFDIIRIPQWALRAERFGENSHAEVIWLPYPAVDNIGKPGAEFYPLPQGAPAGFAQAVNDVDKPKRRSNFGLRASTLRAGWDVSAFYYRSTDVNPTFYRDVVLAPAPTLVFTPRHERIWQAGSTLAKDFGSVVGKAELIYASGRKFNVTRLTEPTGLVPQDTLDYVLGLDFTLPRDSRLNLQYFERVFFDHDPDLVHDEREGGITALFSTKLGADFVPELLLIQSVNRSDRLARWKLGWTGIRNVRLTFGVDLFSGPPAGFFGRFNSRDRVYLDARYDF